MATSAKNQCIASGVNPDPTVRLSAGELSVVIGYTSAILDVQHACIVNSVLGGALETNDDFPTSALSAQTVCATGVSLNECVDRLISADPDFGVWIAGKADATKRATGAQIDALAAQERQRVIESEVALAKRAAQVAEYAAQSGFDILAFVAKHPLITIGTVLVVIAGVYVAANTAEG